MAGDMSTSKHVSSASTPTAGQSDLWANVLPVLQSKEERRRFYNKIAGVYDLLAERAEQPIRERAFELLDPKPGEKILEIGFGTGHMLLRIAKAVGETGKAYGIDIAEKMVERTRELFQREGFLDRVELRRGDAEKLPFQEGAFDGLFMCFTLELFDIPELPRVLAECRRVLKPGGRLVNASLSKNAGPDLVVKAFEWTHAHFPNLMDCRPIPVRQAIEQAGFQVERSEIMHMWVPVEIVKAIHPQDAAAGPEESERAS